jgi:hypothetical protein
MCHAPKERKRSGVVQDSLVFQKGLENPRLGGNYAIYWKIKILTAGLIGIMYNFTSDL